MKNSNQILIALSLIVCLHLSASSQTPSPAPQIRPEPPVGKGTVVLKAARLIDGTGAGVINNAVVVMTDNSIVSVGTSGAVTVPANAKVIDLGNVTLLPGFIDAHTHLVGRVLGDPEGEMSAVRDFESFPAILSVQNARATLMAGFTSVRNVVASGRFDDMALRKAINEGWTPAREWRRPVTRLESEEGTATRMDFVQAYWTRELKTELLTGLSRFVQRCVIKSNTARM